MTNLFSPEEEEEEEASQTKAQGPGGQRRSFQVCTVRGGCGGLLLGPLLTGRAEERKVAESGMDLRL